MGVDGRHLKERADRRDDGRPSNAGDVMAAVPPGRLVIVVAVVVIDAVGTTAVVGRCLPAVRLGSLAQPAGSHTAAAQQRPVRH